VNDVGTLSIGTPGSAISHDMSVVMVIESRSEKSEIISRACTRYIPHACRNSFCSFTLFVRNLLFLKLLSHMASKKLHRKMITETENTSGLKLHCRPLYVPLNSLQSSKHVMLKCHQEKKILTFECEISCDLNVPGRYPITCYRFVE